MAVIQREVIEKIEKQTEEKERKNKNKRKKITI